MKTGSVAAFASLSSYSTGIIVGDGGPHAVVVGILVLVTSFVLGLFIGEDL